MLGSREGLLKVDPSRASLCDWGLAFEEENMGLLSLPFAPVLFGHKVNFLTIPDVPATI